MSKQTNTGAGTSLPLRVEVVDLFNLVQWAAPASSAFGNANFGTITNQANNMRLVQFSARFQFRRVLGRSEDQPLRTLT